MLNTGEDKMCSFPPARTSATLFFPTGRGAALDGFHKVQLAVVGLGFRVCSPFAAHSCSDVVVVFQGVGGCILQCVWSLQRAVGFYTPVCPKIFKSWRQYSGVWDLLPKTIMIHDVIKMSPQWLDVGLPCIEKESFQDLAMEFPFKRQVFVQVSYQEGMLAHCFNL